MHLTALIMWIIKLTIDCKKIIVDVQTTITEVSDFLHKIPTKYFSLKQNTNCGCDFIKTESSFKTV